MKYAGNLARWILLLVILIVVFFLLLKRAPGEVASKPVRNPDIFHYTNPRTYQMGYVLGLDIVKISGKTWTVLTWKPSYSPLVYTESLLFCGPKATELFVNLTSSDEIVIVYSRAVETGKADGPPPNVLACHTLEAVRKVQVSP